MIKRFYILLLAIVASVGMSLNASDYLYMVINGTAGTLKCGDPGENPYYIKKFGYSGATWFGEGIADFKAACQTVTVDASCQDFSGAELTDLFANFTSLTEITDIENINTTNVTGMAEVFHNCPSLTSLDLTSWNTDNVTTMQWMFKDCAGLTSLDLSTWNTDSLKSVMQMFGGCVNLEHIYVGNGWVTDGIKLSASKYMFENCSKLPNWDGTTNKTKAYAGAGGYLEWSGAPTPAVDPEPTPAEPTIVITTNTSQSSYTQGNITITCSKPGDSDGFYLQEYGNETATITVSGSSTISQIELSIGWLPQNRSYVRANGAEPTSSDENSITFSNVNSNNVTLTITDEKIQIRNVTITLAGEGGSTPAGLQVTELQVPASWQDNPTMLSTSDMPGFVAITEAEAKAWDAAPAGNVVLIFAFEGDGATALSFKNGVYQASQAHNITYEDIYGWSVLGRQIFYTGGGSTPAVDPEPTPAGIQVTEFIVPAEWESAETKLLVSDLPGFGAADPYTTQRWNEVPSSGYVYLIYAFESDGRVKYHMFSDGVRYSSPTKNIWKPEIFSESNSGTKFYYTTGPSNWGPEELPQVSEITNPPSEWYQDFTAISTEEMPGFVTVDDEIVKAWDGAPQGSAILISSVGSEFKYHNFRDGVYQYTVDDPLARSTVYFNITDPDIAGRVFYTTGTIPGGSTPTPDPQDPQPTAGGGKLSGAFSVGSDKVVYFSQGNLQYQASTNTWRFAENQYEAVGGNNGTNNAAPYNNTSSANHSPSDSQTGWIDLFGWAASGISRTGVNAYQPYSTSTTYMDYGTTSTKSAGETLGNYDWGKNMGDDWRTLTAEEWGYLIGPGNGGTTPSDQRANYQSLRGLCKITVSGTDYPGMIILPDDLYDNLPAEGDIATKWAACAVAAGSLDYTKATFTEAEWTALQAAGAVFLPAAGCRNGTTVGYAGSLGNYWSSSAYSDTHAYNLFFYTCSLHPEYILGRYNGYSVRLVSETAPAGGGSTPDPEPTVEANIFNYKYDCSRYPTYPKNYSSCELYNFENEVAGPWKLEFVENVDLNSTTYQVDAKALWNILNEYYDNVPGYWDSDIAALVEAHPVPVFNLYQWNGSAYELMNIGYVLAYANLANTTEHAAVFRTMDGTSFRYFTDQAHGSNDDIFINFDVDLTDGLSDLVSAGGSTPTPTPAGTVTVVFEANNNQKEVEVTLPHTFACDFQNGNGELDGIIQELYALQYGGYCQAFTVPTATGNAAVTANKDGNNHYIAISEAFEGTATVTGNYSKFLDTEHMGNTAVDYTLTISVQGSTPTSNLEVTELVPPASWQGNDTKITESDLPGFAEVSYEEAQAWDGAPAEGQTFLIFKFHVSDGACAYSFEDGVRTTDYWYNLDYQSLYFLSNNGTKIYYTSGSSNPEIKLYGDIFGLYSETDAFTDNGDGTATLTLLALEARRYNIFVKVDDAELSSGHNFTRENPSAVVTGNYLAMWFDTDVAGDYIFTFEYATNTLTITYPSSGGSTPAVDGKLSGAFSIGNGKKVYFSRGNLQATYDGSNWTWGFAEHQYDRIGNAAANNTVNGLASIDGTGTVDLFGWSSKNRYYGIDNSTEWSDYGSGFKSSFVDWGNTVGGDWRTLTTSEWRQIVAYRTNAANLRAMATVDGIRGLILMPDNWTASGISLVITMEGYTDNQLTISQWETLESQGCVFLPAGGIRVYQYGYYDFNENYGSYWAAPNMTGEAESGQCMYFPTNDPGDAWGNINVSTGSVPAGHSVRLVSETAPAAILANVIALIDAIGTVEYTDESKAKIDAAREAYDALSDATKALVTNLATLEAAEQAYADLKAAADIIPCTAADLGKVLCTDGSIYATVSDATDASKTAAAVIAYIDTENGKGLALALADDGGEMNWETAITTAAAHTPAVNGGTWTLASKDDWNNMITAAGSYTALCDRFSSVGGTNMNNAPYWSSSTSSNYNAWAYNFNNGKWYDTYKDSPYRVRACLAFVVPTTPAYETVMNLIDAIPNPAVLTAECKEKVDAARTAYNALSNEDKDLVTNIATLTTAEAAFENVMNIWLSGDCDVILWNDTTLTVRKHAGEGNGAMKDYTDYYGDEITPWFSDHWYNPQPDDIVIKAITIGEGVTHIGTDAFGWMDGLKTVTIPASVTSIGDEAFYWSRAVDDVYIYADPANLTWVAGTQANGNFKENKATLCHVPVDLLAGYQEKFDATINVTFVGDLAPVTPLTPEEQAAIDAVKAKIDAIPQPVVYTEACKAAIDSARAAYDALATDVMKLLVDNYAVLTAAEDAYAQAKIDKAAADAVIELINEIPQPATAKLSVYDKVVPARAAYDALTDAQNALVTNYSTLTAAEALFDGLTGGGTGVEGLLTTITVSNSVVNHSVENIVDINQDAAVLGENGWTSGMVEVSAKPGFTITKVEYLQSDGMFGVGDADISAPFEISITNGMTLTKLQVYGYEALSPIAQAQAALALINAIPAEIVKTADCKNAIDAARAALDALDPAALALIDDVDLAKLTNAEATWAATPYVWTSGDCEVKIYDDSTMVVSKISGEGNGVMDNYGSWSSVPWQAHRNAVDSLVIEEGVTVLGKYAFYALNIKGALVIPEGVTTLRENTFYGNSKVTSITLPTTITHIAEQYNAFYGCTGVTDIYLPVNPLNLTWIDDNDDFKPAKATLCHVPADCYDAYIAKFVTGLAADHQPNVTFVGDLAVALPEAQRDSINNVKTLIDTIPTPVAYTTACKTAIDDARAAYNALSDDLKLFVGNYNMLADAEDAYAQAKIDFEAAAPVIALINEIPQPATAKLSVYDKVVPARGAYDALTDAQKALISTEELQKLLDAEALFNAIDSQTITAAQTAVALINALPSEITLQSSDAIEAAREAVETLDAYQSLIDDADMNKLTQAEADYALLIQSASDVRDLIDSIPQPVVYTAECKNAIDAARAAYDALSDELKPFVSNYNTLTDAEDAYAQAKADQEAAAPVIDLLDAIPATVELKVAVNRAIEAAREAYDALTEDQKALISADELQKLTDAETEWAMVVEGHEMEYANAEAVAVLIDAIPQPVVYDATCGGAIAAAEEAFNQLSDDEKAILDEPFTQTLISAATWYNATDAIVAIEAIPEEIVYDASIRTAIETAAFKFDALSDASKALVSDSLQNVLSSARDQWAALVAKVEHKVTYIGKDGELKQEIVTLFNIPETVPDVNGYEFARWDVQTTELYYEGVQIKAIYSPIITENPVAYDTLVYTGMAQNLVSAAECKEGHVEYRIGEGEWSSELPQANNAGAYAIQYKLVREGHEDYIVPQTVLAQIAKAPVTYVAPEAYSSLVYTAAAQTLVLAGQTQDGTFEYTLDPTNENSWRTELPQYTSADTIMVSFRVIGDANHLDSVAPAPVQVVIAKAALTATADDKTVTYGDAVPAYTVTYEGWLGEDTISVLQGQIAYACDYRDTTGIGEYTIVPSGVTAHDYDITFVNGKVTVNKALLTITADDKTITYADAIPAYTASYQGFKNNDNEALVSGLTFTCEYAPTSNVGEYTITPDNATAHNYEMEYVNGKVTVNKAELLISANDTTITYGDAIPVYEASYQGFKNDDTDAVIDGLTYNCDYVPTSNVGEYMIILTGATATNYNINYNSGKVTVNKALLTITADDKNVIYGDAIPTYTPTYAGWKNEDNETVLSGLTFACEYAPTSNVGEYTIVPANAEATNYCFSYVNGKVSVAKAALTITANDTTITYGDAVPEFTASYNGFRNQDDDSVISDLAFTTPYVITSYVGEYVINPHSATAQNYEITFVDGKMTVIPAVVYVTGAEAQIAKFEDGTTDAVVLQQGILHDVRLNNAVGHKTTAAFGTAQVGENQTITLFYELTGDAALLANYNLTPASGVFTTEGVIIEQMIPDDEPEEKEQKQAEVEEGIEVYAYGYCDGSGYSLRYHLETGMPDQYMIEYEDSRFTDVDWTNLAVTGRDGHIDIEIPVDMPTGDYKMTVVFRDSRFVWLESKPFEVTFHVNLPETYVTPLFGNTIALVDTCECFTDIQWYWRANSNDLWQPIEGANGHYYHVDGELTGEYFVQAKVNGEPTFTCAQTDMKTLYGTDNKAQVVVRAFPNPVISTTTVTIENSENDIHNLRVISLMGVEIMNTTFEGTHTTVQMDGFVQGNYMISVDGVVVKVMKK